MGLPNRTRDFTSATWAELMESLSGPTEESREFRDFWNNYGSCFDNLDLWNEAVMIDEFISRSRYLMSDLAPREFQRVYDRIHELDEAFGKDCENTVAEIQNFGTGIDLLTGAISGKSFPASFEKDILRTQLQEFQVGSETRFQGDYGRLIRDFGMTEAEIERILSALKTAGYTGAEQSTMLRGIRNANDVQVLRSFGGQPISYEALFSVDSKRLSDSMLLGLTMHLDILNRESSPSWNQALSASFGFFDFVRLDTAAANNGAYGFYNSAKSLIINESRNLIFDERFGNYSLVDKYVVANGSEAALTVMRLMLNDSYFTQSELTLSQNLVNTFHQLKQKYPEFPLIIGNDDSGKATIFVGGNQAWYAIHGNNAGVEGGCGPTAAANVFAGMALQDANIAMLLGYPQWNSTGVATMGEYLELMEDVYETVKPFETDQLAPWLTFLTSQGGLVDNILDKYPSLGIVDSNYFNNQLEKYAQNYGFGMSNSSYDQFWGGPYDLAGIKSALDAGEQVTFLNMWTSLDLHNPNGSIGYGGYQQHWVNIIGYDGNKLLVSSWGNEYYIEYSEIQNAWNTNPMQGWNNISSHTYP